LIELAADDSRSAADLASVIKKDPKLGLALARKIFEAHNGRVSLTVEEGAGNRVTLLLQAVA